MKSKETFNPLFETNFVCNIKGRMVDFQAGLEKIPFLSLTQAVCL